MVRASLAKTKLTSNKREWNNCFIKFRTILYVKITAKFNWLLILQNNRKFMWQKRQQVGSHVARGEVQP